jgi:hypothetical protein
MRDFSTFVHWLTWKLYVYYYCTLKRILYISKGASEEFSKLSRNFSKHIRKCFNPRIRSIREVGRWKTLWNPDLHCLKVITKLKATRWKEPLLPHPLHITVGEGGVGCFLCSPEDVTWVVLAVSWKAHWKGRFHEKPLKNQKKPVLIHFASIFWF